MYLNVMAPISDSTNPIMMITFACLALQMEMNLVQLNVFVLARNSKFHIKMKINVKACANLLSTSGRINGSLKLGVEGGKSYSDSQSRRKKIKQRVKVYS